MKNVFICGLIDLAGVPDHLRGGTLLVEEGLFVPDTSSYRSIDTVGAGENFSHALSGRTGDIVFVSENQEHKIQMRQSAIENNFSIFQ